MAVAPFLQGGTSLGVVGYRSPRIIETAGEPFRGDILQCSLSQGMRRPVHGEVSATAIDAPLFVCYIRIR